MVSAFATPVALLPKGRRVSVSTRPTWRATATQPAQTKVRRAENVPGKFYVDSSCIDCDTCRWLAKDTFHIAGPQSAVHTQPQTEAERIKALRAVDACPTGSIRTESPDELLSVARDSFPLPVYPNLTSTPVEGVYLAGQTAMQTYGGAGWLLIHRGEEEFAVLFDCPRYSPKLAKRIIEMTEAVGGVKYIVLSHCHDVFGHDKWAKALGAQRIIHKAETTEEQGTTACEIQLSDSDYPYRVGEDTQLLHFPGHSPGSTAMLHSKTKSLFAGDHFTYMPRMGSLASTDVYCMQSWSLQIKSVEKLADVPFLHGWPGHCRHYHFRDDEHRREEIAKAVAFMHTVTANMP